MKRKAQSEVIIIIVLLALVIVAGYLVFQSAFFQGIIEPGALSEEQKTVKENVESFMMSGLNDVVHEVSSTGGKLKSDLRSESEFATLGNENIIYWQACSNDISPELVEISQSISKKLTEYVRNNLDELEFARDVQFGEPSVSASIFDDRIDIAVNLPTTIEGQTFSRYSLSLRTDFGKIYKFSKAFVKDNMVSRHFENIAFEAMYMSKMRYDDGTLSNDFVPVWIKQIPGTSPYLIKTSFELAKSTESLIDSALNKIYLWKPSGDPGYSIISLGGITYPSFHAAESSYNDINVRAYLAKQYTDMDFRLGPLNFKSIPDPVVLRSKSKPFIGPVIDFSTWVMPKVIVAYYTFTFPVVLTVKDSGTGNYFKFAVLNHVDYKVTENAFGNMNVKLLGDCGGLLEGVGCTGDYSAEKAKITVIDKDTSVPVQGAKVTISGCGLYDEGEGKYISTTDDLGEIEGNLPNGFGCTSNFKAEKDNYQTYTEVLTCEDELTAGKTVALKRNPTLEFKFYELFIEKRHVQEFGCSTGYKYVINTYLENGESNPTLIDSTKNYDYQVLLKFIDKNTDDEFYVTNTKRTEDTEIPLGVLEVGIIPSGEYDVDLFTFKKRFTGYYDSLVDADEVLEISDNKYEGTILSVHQGYINIDKSMQTKWSNADTGMVSNFLFRARPFCETGIDCGPWTFVSTVEGVGTAGGTSNEILLADNPLDESKDVIDAGFEYQILNLRFDYYMHMTDEITIPEVTSLPDGKKTYGVYVPILEEDRVHKIPAGSIPGYSEYDDVPYSFVQKRLFNMLDYEKQQDFIENVMTSDPTTGCDIKILDLPGMALTNECVFPSYVSDYPEEWTELCWVTPWQIRYSSGGYLECGSHKPYAGIGGVGAKKGCADGYYSCMVGDTYATHQDCFPSSCPVEGVYIC